MSVHAIDEAGERLGELVDRALAGEDVVLTRDGRPLVELRPIAPAQLAAGQSKDRQSLRPEDFDWLAERRKTRPSRSNIGAGEFVSRMRDEDWR